MCHIYTSYLSTKGNADVVTLYSKIGNAENKHYPSSCQSIITRRTEIRCKSVLLMIPPRK
jgi:hypothetical protein